MDDNQLKITLMIHAQQLRWQIDDCTQGLRFLQATERQLVEHRLPELLQSSMETNDQVRHHRRQLRKRLDQVLASLRKDR